MCTLAGQAQLGVSQCFRVPLNSILEGQAQLSRSLFYDAVCSCSMFGLILVFVLYSVWSLTL